MNIEHSISVHGGSNSFWHAKEFNATTSSMLLKLLIPENATLKFLKHMSKNSVNHGLNTNLRVNDFVVIRIEELGFSSDKRLQSNYIHTNALQFDLNPKPTP